MSSNSCHAATSSRLEGADSPPRARAPRPARVPALLAEGSRVLMRDAGWVRVDSIPGGGGEVWTGVRWGRVSVEPEDRLLTATTISLRDGSEVTCSPRQPVLVLGAGDKVEFVAAAQLAAGATLPGYRIPESERWDPGERGAAADAEMFKLGAQIGRRLGEQFTFDGGLSDEIMNCSSRALASFLRGVASRQAGREIFGDLAALRDLRLLCARTGIRASVVEDQQAPGKGILAAVGSAGDVIPKRRGHSEVDNHINHSVMRVRTGKQARGFRVRGADTPFVLVDGFLVMC